MSGIASIEESSFSAIPWKGNSGIYYFKMDTAPVTKKQSTCFASPRC